MKLLLDTATLLWSYLQKSRLSAAASKAILNETNEVFVSAESYWEIAIKLSIGKLSLADPITEFVRGAVEANGYTILHVSPEHAERAAHARGACTLDARSSRVPRASAP